MIKVIRVSNVIDDMEKNVKRLKGEWRLDTWKWQVSKPQMNAPTAVFILEDENDLS